MVANMRDDEAIITGMDCNPTWMYTHYTPIKNNYEGNKINKAIDKPDKK